MKCVKSFLAIGVALSLVFAASAHARIEVVNALQDPANPTGSTFGLDFGDNGGLRSQQISSTEFQLNFNAATSRAQFVSYQQSVPSLTLPDGTEAGTATGPITVTMIPGEGGSLIDNGDGSFNFATVDHYIIEFTGDLTAFGIPGQQVFFENVLATGRVVFDQTRGAADAGQVDLNWNGDGVLLDPASPVGALLPFTYECTLTMIFSSGCNSRATCPEADVDCNHIVNGLDLALIASSSNLGQLGDAAEEPRADVDGNGTINGLDIAAAASSVCFGK
jgi:hypothetical protein